MSILYFDTKFINLRRTYAKIGLIVLVSYMYYKLYYWIISPFCNMTLHVLEAWTNLKKINDGRGTKVKFKTHSVLLNDILPDLMG